MMRIWLTYIFVFFTVLSFAQEGDYFLSIKHYPFIKYAENEITYPANNNSFEQLYQKLDSIILFGKGKINIVHIGGSHIQADIYTHQIRKRLQLLQYDMNGGRGLIFPFNIAKTNKPSNYKVKYSGEWTYCKNTKYKRTCPLGLTGISISTISKSATIYISPNTDSTIKYTFNKVKLYHSPTLYSISVLNNKTSILGIYDSIGGYSVFNLPESKELSLDFKINDSIADDLTIYGISLDNDAPGIVYHSIGVNGAKLESYLYCEMFEQHMASLNPDLVIFSIGTNDGNTKYLNSEKFRNEYIQLINNAKQAAPNAHILITIPNDAYYYKRYVNKNTLILRDEIYSIAKSYGYGVWDLFNIMGGLNSSQTWYNYGLMKYDRVHFSHSGYILKGDLFVAAFLRAWEKNLNLRTETYFKHKEISKGFLSSQIEIK